MNCYMFLAFAAVLFVPLWDYCVSPKLSDSTSQCCSHISWVNEFVTADPSRYVFQQLTLYHKMKLLCSACLAFPNNDAVLIILSSIRVADIFNLHIRHQEETYIKLVQIVCNGWPLSFWIWTQCSRSQLSVPHVTLFMLAFTVWTCQEALEITSWCCRVCSVVFFLLCIYCSNSVQSNHILQAVVGDTTSFVCLLTAW